LDFPAVSTIQVNAETFKNITISRKNSPYKKALEIAKLIILNFAPNISLGREKMIAILFDMNVLWEDYVFQRLRFLDDSNLEIKGQMSKSFWSGVKIRPDIVISYKGNKYIIDTKWKNLNGFKPSADDLRQMYVYNDYWGANKSILLYPSTVPVPPNFITFDSRADGDVNHQCGLGLVSVFHEDTVRLNRHLGLDILGYLD
jgi:5-methylcytosine-specific restriction enzyme subunit McrC